MVYTTPIGRTGTSGIFDGNSINPGAVDGSIRFEFSTLGSEDGPFVSAFMEDVAVVEQHKLDVTTTYKSEFTPDPFCPNPLGACVCVMVSERKI
jgi:hypothetical protein